jgi:hypothetical protein
MNFFNLFKKRGTVRFINTWPGVYEMHPIIEAKKLKRDWVEKNAQMLHDHQEKIKTCPFSELQRYIDNHGFIVKCPGIRNAMNAGYIISSPFDVIIETFGDGRKCEAISLAPKVINHTITKHPKEQFAGFVPQPLGTMPDALKFPTGWHIKPDKNYIYLITSPLYTGESRFTTATGILDPYDDPQLNALMFWHVLKGREIIKAGTPLIQLIPFPRNFVQPKIDQGPATGREQYQLKASASLVTMSYNRNPLKVKEAAKKIYDVKS